MDLDNQEWLFTLLLHKKLKKDSLLKLREHYTKQVTELLANINRIDKELGDIEKMDEMDLIGKIDKLSNGDLNKRRLMINTLNYVLDNFNTVGMQIHNKHYANEIKKFNRGQDERDR